MKDQNYLLKCIECGTAFFNEGEKIFYQSKNLKNPKRCKVCRDRRKEKYHKINKEKKARELEIAISKLSLKQCNISEIPLVDLDNMLTIVGNGFDLMHGVKSSYYNFRDSLGKSNSLRFALETYLRVDDLWSNFEESLLHIDSGAMYNVLDMWLDNFNAYDIESKASNFYMAIDAATGPAQTIVNDLPRRFRMWVESLTLPDPGYKPLNGIMKNVKTLNFNYTEFVENLYSVDKENICYIHGCRRKEKYKPKEELILGHIPSSNVDDLELNFELPNYKSKRKHEMIEGAIDTASRNLSWYDTETTKYSKGLIKKHQDFFHSLSNVEQIIIVGHSLSQVDWDYFNEIINMNKNKEAIEWFISYHSINDIENIIIFIDEMGINIEQINLFHH